MGFSATPQNVVSLYPSILAPADVGESNYKRAKEENRGIKVSMKGESEVSVVEHVLEAY